jgi:hypothetical protein
VLLQHRVCIHVNLQYATSQHVSRSGNPPSYFQAEQLLVSAARPALQPPASAAGLLLLEPGGSALAMVTGPHCQLPLLLLPPLLLLVRKCAAGACW